MPYTCELIMLNRDTCGMPADACPYCSRPHYFCPQCLPEHNKIHQPPPAHADADSIAAAMAVALYVARVKFKFRGEGSTFGPKAVLIWDSIVVEAEMPVTGELFRLHSIKELQEFLIKAELHRQLAQKR